MSSYPPTPQRKACNCSDPCISTDDVYYAGPNLPNSGINTYNVLTEVIEKLDAIYAVPTLQKVTEADNITTLPLVADSFVKIGGSGSNLLLDNGTTISISAIGGNQNLQEVTDEGAITTNPITANSFIKSGGDGSNLLLDNGNVLPIGDLPIQITKTSELTNDGQDGINPFITALDIPAFNPSDYDLDEFTNNNVDPFSKISDLPVYSDFIQDSITNGVIDKAPTENAVYDALQLKQNNLGYTPVNIAGDTMSGLLVLSGDPGAALGAATKQYVDNISSNVNFHSPVYTATTGNLIANYDNGVAGVGATLIATTNGALQVDGEFPSYLDRVLVWQQNDAFQNGVYKVDVVGDSITPYTLIRSTDSDNNPAGEIRYGDYTLILSGDTNGGKGFICNTVGTVVVGTTPITFVQYNVAQAVTPGYGLLTSSPNVIAIDTAITQEKIELTTDGSGAATLDPLTNILNIPTPSGETTATMGALIGSAGNATPNDTDYVATALTAGGLLKKITWTNVKAFLKTYFDTIYAPNIYNILIDETTSISTDTLGLYGSTSYSQNGKNVMINNQTTDIIFQVNATSSTNFIATYTKLSASGVKITFQSGTATLNSPTGLFILSGSIGSTALLTRNGNAYYLLLNNL